jgi:thiamine monophosphate kinase
VREAAAATGRDALQLAVSGGEDYELLAALPAKGLDLAALAEEAGLPVTRVGEAVAGAGVEIRLPGGRSLEPAGFDQLA